MSRLIRKLVVSAGFLAFVSLGSAASNAAPILSDNFDTENGGAPVLNYGSFTNFDVSSGSVDLIGNGYFDFYPGNGLYVDLCGSTGVCGGLTTKQVFAAGTYTITLNLAGNARINTSDGVNVTFGSSSNNYNAPSYNTPFTVTNTLTLALPSALTISDLGLTGNPNVGTILFSVAIDSKNEVPEPATWALLLVGLAVVGFGMRQRKTISLAA